MAVQKDYDQIMMDDTSVVFFKFESQSCHFSHLYNLPKMCSGYWIHKKVRVTKVNVNNKHLYLSPNYFIFARKMKSL